MAVNLIPFIKSQWFDSSGNPLSGGKVQTFAAGTSTPLATYTDSTGSVANSNPVILDSAGRADIWLLPQPYKIVLQNSAGVQVWSEDNIPGNGLNGPLQLFETAAPAGVVGSDLLYADSSAHRLKMNNNNAGADTVVGAATTDTLTNKTLAGAATGNNVNARLTIGQQAQQTGTGAAAAITGFSYTIPANTVSATSSVEIYWMVSHTAGTASIAYTMDLGDAGGQSLGSSTATAISGIVVITKGTQGNPNLYVATITTWPTGANPIVSTGVTVATVVSQSCTVTFKFNVANTDTIVGQQFIVKQNQ